LPPHASLESSPERASSADPIPNSDPLTAAKAAGLHYVEHYGTNGVTHGLLIARGTDDMYLTSVQDERLRWPDTFSQGPDGAIYVTTSHIQDSAFFKPDAPPALPTQLWKLRLDD
jgi:hypothetical protein